MQVFTTVKNNRLKTGTAMMSNNRKHQVSYRTSILHLDAIVKTTFTKALGPHRKHAWQGVRLEKQRQHCI